MLDFLKKHPTIGGAILSGVGAVLGIYIHDPALVGSLVALAGVFLGLHQVVTPVTTAAQNITTAATAAATQAVQDLGSATVGSVGEVTAVGKDVINNAVDRVVGGLLGKR